MQLLLQYSIPGDPWVKPSHPVPVIGSAMAKIPYKHQPISPAGCCTVWDWTTAAITGNRWVESAHTKWELSTVSCSKGYCRPLTFGGAECKFGETKKWDWANAWAYMLWHLRAHACSILLWVRRLYLFCYNIPLGSGGCSNSPPFGWRIGVLPLRHSESILINWLIGLLSRLSWFSQFVIRCCCLLHIPQIEF